jgi:FixJ family two-component response regulator
MKRNFKAPLLSGQVPLSPNDPTIHPQHVATRSNVLSNALVYVIDSDESSCSSVGALLAMIGIQVRLHASVENFLSAERPDKPGCIVLDVRLRGAGGLTLLQLAAMERIHLPIIYLTANGNIEMAVAAMKAGAFDFLTKPFREQDLLDVVSTAISWDVELWHREKAAGRIRRAYDSLTRREREVIWLVADGMRNKQIAEYLRLSEVTIKMHRTRAMRKLGALSVPDAIRTLQHIDARSSPPE